MILLDSNVVIDLVEMDPHWSGWSREAIAAAGARDTLATSAIVIAETSGLFGSLEAQLGYFAGLEVSVHDLDAAAARRAGHAHRAYRRAGGTRVGVLADFLIGGHASVLGAILLTRDRRRFASYFPELTLITPESDHG